MPGRQGLERGVHDDHVDLVLDQVCDRLRRTTVIAVGGSPLDYHVASLNEALIQQALTEGLPEFIEPHPSLEDPDIAQGRRLPRIGGAGDTERSEEPDYDGKGESQQTPHHLIALPCVRQDRLPDGTPALFRLLVAMTRNSRVAGVHFGLNSSSAR